MRMRTPLLAFLVLSVACGSPATQCPPQTAAAAAGDEHASHDHGSHDHAPPDHAPTTMQHDFSDVAAFERMFEAPDRVVWQRPVEVVRLLDAQPGQTLVDLGTGTGYFLPLLSIAAGAHGHVLALDNEAAMIEHVRARAEREGLANVEAQVVDGADPGLPSQSVDRVLVVDTWHHLPDRVAYATHLRDALRPGGSVLVVDFTLDATRGPPVADRLPPETVAVELVSAGLVAEVLTENLPEQYVVRGRLPD